MKRNIRTVNDINGLIEYFVSTLNWKIDLDYFEDIEDITYDFDAEDIGLKEEAFAKIKTLRQLRPLVDGQKWGIFCVEFDSRKFEITALRKILSGLIPTRRNSTEHAVWDQQDLLFICFWGEGDERTIGIAHFEDKEFGLPQIKMIYCAPAVEDFTQIRVFEDRLKSLKWPEEFVDHDRWQVEWSSAFKTAYRQTINDVSTLTAQLAVEAQGIRDRILSILEVETRNGYVHLLYDKFKATLIHDMTETQFADMYAQTVVYGLFSARCMDETQEDFSAAEAVECIPSTNPFLKSLMKECLGSNNSKLSFDELEIGNVVDLLLHTKTDAIIQDFNRQTGGGREDPVIHFYEEFLEAYDKTQKVQRGVFYTPQPVVNFIVRAVDSIIRDEFGFEDGLASTEIKKVKNSPQSKRRTKEVPAIQLLDPATGTGTFIRQAVLQIYSNFKEKNKEVDADELKKKWNQYVSAHLLPRLNAFELMMAPYAVAHMKLAMVLKDTGYDFNSDERLNVYLTNTLEKPGNSDMQITMFDDPLASESIAANAVKKNDGINILIGNPPYSGESANKGPWIMQLMEDYKKEPGSEIRLKEKNPKWLNDDYVKFIRYAQNIIDNSTGGVLAYINPHGFIANPTFRGMRWSLMQSFDSIYIIDLHGNSNRKETCPDGSKDENVFDIQQGVCICLFVKSKEKSSVKSKSSCRVWHADVYGTRNAKYDYLSRAELSSIDFKEVFPQKPDCLFHTVDVTRKNNYDNGFSVNDLFLTSAVGLITARDSLNLSFSKSELYDRLENFRKLDEDEARVTYSLGKDVRDWKVQWAQNDINNNAVSDGRLREDMIIPVLYRPFDLRYMLYTGVSRGLVCYPRSEVTDHFLLGNNIGLATGRTNKSTTCDHFIAVNHMAEVKFAERSTGSVIYPLYRYVSIAGKLVMSVNMDKEIIKEFSSRLGITYYDATDKTRKDNGFCERDLFDYIYATLYCRKYREDYFEFLKSDYPKVPFESDKERFWKMVELGKRLVLLHTSWTNGEPDPISRFTDNGRQVEKVKYKDGKIYINKKSFFSEVSEKTWAFIMGGYQPLLQWYKGRKGTALSDEDVESYERIIQIINETLEIMDEIESVC